MMVLDIAILNEEVIDEIHWNPFFKKFHQDQMELITMK